MLLPIASASPAASRRADGWSASRTAATPLAPCESIPVRTQPWRGISGALISPGPQFTLSAALQLDQDEYATLVSSQRNGRRIHE